MIGLSGPRQEYQRQRAHVYLRKQSEKVPLRAKGPKYGAIQAARVWMKMHGAEVLANEIMRPTYTGVQWCPY
ncbi:hypothetical protein FJTKL_07875 [Diaporthe vaccinii]|uniref:Uncharacterized protein n=1 Tax=Diaporthe vaccinii TaxID=105482 RepID=A0ABR4FE62_9PEZI